MSKAKRKSRDSAPGVPHLRAVRDGAGALSSPTAVAAEALRTGVIPLVAARRRDEIPGEGETIRAGDPDDSSLANEYVGEETPGGTTPTPDQNSVDEIGRVYGLQEEDTGALRSGAEVLTRRDRHRQELQPPPKPEP
jgi:uncharacterized protein DUF6335